MPIRVAHMIDYALPADLVHLAMTHPDSVSARSRDRGWTLISAEHAERPDGGLEIDVLTRAPLPPPVRAVVRGELVLRRTTYWRPVADGYQGTVKVLIPHVPGRAVITVRNTRRAGDRCRVRVAAVVSVSAPFVGRVLERVLADFFRARAVQEPRLLVEWLATTGRLAADTRTGDLVRVRPWDNDPTSSG